VALALDDAVEVAGWLEVEELHAAAASATMAAGTANRMLFGIECNGTP